MRDNILWTVTRLAEATGIPRQHVAEKLRDVAPAGEVRRGTPGWPLEDVLRPLVAAGEFQRERGRLVAAQASMAELELKQRRGELLPADEVARADEAIYGALRDAFLGLPSAVAQMVCEVAAAEGPAGVDAFLRERIEEILEDAANAEFVDE